MIAEEYGLEPICDWDISSDEQIYEYMNESTENESNQYIYKSVNTN